MNVIINTDNTLISSAENVLVDSHSDSSFLRYSDQSQQIVRTNLQKDRKLGMQASLRGLASRKA